MICVALSSVSAVAFTPRAAAMALLLIASTVVLEGTPDCSTSITNATCVELQLLNVTFSINPNSLTLTLLSTTSARFWPTCCSMPREMMNNQLLTVCSWRRLSLSAATSTEQIVSSASPHTEC